MLGGVMNQYDTSSKVNALRVSAVIERLSGYFKRQTANSQIPNSMEYFNLLLSLARGIDYSIANNEIPPRAKDLPKVLNEIRLRKADACLQGIVMVLMMSVKTACSAGWFHEKEAQDLIAYADEIARCFCDPRDINVATNDSHSAISTILSRFYPQIKMGQVLASLEVQSGYGAYAVDFLITKGLTHLPEEKFMLFVARIDSLETSACIITPQQVSFLLNGKGVDRRTNTFLDPGPQMPNNISSVLKYGTNLLQAVGQFNGRYVVSIALMSISPQPEPTLLKDYVQPAVSTLDSDSDLIEGQSRISLNCPISRTRIQVPVKGYSCKHPQCFDYSNYLGINSRRPSWRCPHCNNYVCFTDLRIDQNIAKVLKEVGGNVTDVLISADGSWKAIMESDNDDPDPLQPQVIENQASVGSPNPILDLTEDNDPMDILLSTENEDIKPPQQLPSADQQMNNVSQEDEFWSGVMEYVAASSTAAVFKDTTNTTAVSNQDGLVNAAASGSVQNEGINSGTSVQALPANFPSPGSVQRLRPVNTVPVLGCSSSAAAAVPSVPPSTEVRADLEKQRLIDSRKRKIDDTGRPSQALPAAGRSSPDQRANSVQNPNSPKLPPSRFASFQNAHLQQAFNKARTQLQSHPPGPTSVTGGPRGLTSGTGGPWGPTPGTGGPPGLTSGTGGPRGPTSGTGGPPGLTSGTGGPRGPTSGTGGPPGLTSGTGGARGPTSGTGGASGIRIRIPIRKTTPGQVPRMGTSVPPGFQPSKPAPTEPRGSPKGGDGGSEESWRPSGRMRGSLEGRALPDNLSHLVIQPSRGAARPPPSNLSAPPHLQKSVPTTNRNHLPSSTTPSASGNTHNPQ